MLRILQDGSMERVGAEKSINVDVRIVAATHADLASMVAEGDFREDCGIASRCFRSCCRRCESGAKTSRS